MTRTCLGALCAALISASAQAQDWPQRAITMVVPLAPGGVYDTLGRIYAARLSEILGQQVVVENVGGAGGMTGTARVAKAAPDGYQVVFGGISTHSQVQSLHKKPPYDAAVDFDPVAMVAEQALILITRKTIPGANLADFLRYAKANQAQMQYGSPGPGTGSHLACAMLNVAIGVEVTHVPYRGLGPAMQDLLGDRLDYLCPTMTTGIPQIQGGSVFATAVLTRSRSSILPDVASAHEQGVQDFDAYSWSAIFLPKNVPPAIFRKFHAATMAAMDTPSLQQRLRDLGATVPPPERRSPAFLQAFVEREIKKWAAAIRAAGIAQSD
jgi:tripartite-type tricarboxylate transporter receptor subunit TctC